MEDKSLTNSVCGGAKPRRVLRYFEEICGIPHGSFHTDEISDWLVRFAKERNLDYVQDQAGNVIIRKAGAGSAAAHAPVILQGHMDMVLEKTEDCPLYLEREPIVLKRDGDVLYAEGTTLGGDDGIAVAMMLALLDSEDIPHPDLECVFTVNEEVGMLGAKALDAGVLRGRRMINLDSEEEGIFTVGCAGGAEVHMDFSVKRKPRFGTLLRVSVGGLTGGHSGVCITEGRANADLVLARVLDELYQAVPFRLIRIGGGTKDNAIPRSAKADVLFDQDFDRGEASETLSQSAAAIRKEYAATDPEMAIEARWAVAPEPVQYPMSAKDTRRILRFLNVVPNGLIETDAQDRSMPQTSLNLGILNTDDDGVHAVSLVRSAINSQKDYLNRRIELLVQTLDGKFTVAGSYPAWERAAHSPLCDGMSAIYEKMTKEAPAVVVMHGGVECGVLAAKIEELDEAAGAGYERIAGDDAEGEKRPAGLDCVSIGPDMEGIHTPDEKLSISSVNRTWEFLLEVLKEL